MAQTKIAAMCPTMLDDLCASSEDFEQFVEKLRDDPRVRQAWELGRSKEHELLRLNKTGLNKGQGSRQQLLQLFQLPADESGET